MSRSRAVQSDVKEIVKRLRQVRTRVATLNNESRGFSAKEMPFPEYTERLTGVEDEVSNIIRSLYAVTFERAGVPHA